MREIKFRAFVSKENRYKIPIGMIQGEYIKTILEPKFTQIPAEWCWDECGLILMQYTGLKDKNGKEIYEGDIVRDNYCDYIDDTCKVEFSQGYFYPLVDVEEGYNCIDKYDPDRFEVIGNIHENPELI